MSKKTTTEELLKEYMDKHFPNGYIDVINKLKGEPKDILDLNNSIKDLINTLGRKSSISYTQLRTIHNELQNAKSLDDLALSIHKIVYIEARQDDDKAKAFVRFIRELMQFIITQGEDINTKDTFIDTLVAYHKLYA